MLLKSGRRYSLASIKSLLTTHQLIKLIKQIETKGVRDVRSVGNEWFSVCIRFHTVSKFTKPFARMFNLVFLGCFSGFIFQLSGSYQSAFFVAGGAIAVGACALSLIPFFMTNSKVETTEIREVLCQKDDTKNEDKSYWAEEGQRNSLYDTSNFALRRSISCLALSRVGDVCSTQCILEMIEQETIV